MSKHFCEFCDGRDTIPHTSVSCVAHPVPHRDYPLVLYAGGTITRGTGKHGTTLHIRDYPGRLTSVNLEAYPQKNHTTHRTGPSFIRETEPICWRGVVAGAHHEFLLQRED